MAHTKLKRAKQDNGAKVLRISAKIREAASAVLKAAEDLVNLSRENESESFCFEDYINCVCLQFADANSVEQGQAILMELLPNPDVWFREERHNDKPAKHTRNVGDDTIRTPRTTIMRNRLTELCIRVVRINTGAQGLNLSAGDWDWLDRYGQLLLKSRLLTVEFPENNTDIQPPGLSECQTALAASVKGQISFLHELGRKPKRKQTRIAKGHKSSKSEAPTLSTAKEEPRVSQQPKDVAQKSKIDDPRTPTFVINVKSPTHILVNGEAIRGEPKLNTFRALALLKDKIGPDDSLFFSTKEFVTKIWPDLKGSVSRPWFRCKEALKMVCQGIVIDGDQGKYTVRGLKVEFVGTNFEDFKKQWEASLNDSAAGNPPLPTPTQPTVPLNT